MWSQQGLCLSPVPELGQPCRVALNQGKVTVQCDLGCCLFLGRRMVLGKVAIFSTGQVPESYTAESCHLSCSQQWGNEHLHPRVAQTVYSGDQTSPTVTRFHGYPHIDYKKMPLLFPACHPWKLLANEAQFSTAH